MLNFKRKTPIIFQLSETECGIASLAMIFAYHRINVSIENLREQCGVSRDGCKAQTLIHVAEGYGFKAEAYRFEIEDLKALSMPVIAYWNFNHYVVIKKVSNKKVWLNDPAHGARVVSIDEFDKSFTGVIIVITPEKLKSQTSRPNTFLFLIGDWFYPFYKEILFLLFCLVLMGIIPYLNSAINTVFTDTCITSKNKNWIPTIACLAILSTLILCVLNITYKKVQFKLYSKASLLKVTDIFDHMMKLRMIFYSLRQRSEIIAILVRVDYAINLLFKSGLNFLFGIITALICLLFMIKINVYLALLSMTLTLINLTIFYYITRINLSYEKANITLNGKIYSHVHSSIKNIETIKSCGLEQTVFTKWNALFINKLQTQTYSDVLSSLISALSASFESISMLGLIAIGASQVSWGMISLGNLMGYYSLHLIFYSSFSFIFQSIKDIQSVYIENVRIKDIVGYEQDIRFNQKNKLSNKKYIDQFKNSQQIVSLTDVTFFYNIHSRSVLNNMSFAIKPGAHIAIVGGTGSGKSSLAKLLCGFYQAQIGTVCYFNKSISSYSAEEIASLCAYVSQDISLTEGTLLENLNFTHRNYDHLTLMSAIETACLTDLVATKKLDGIIEENGRNLSGGEKQRVDIARALLQDTPILILDEATSALDVNTETALIKNLRQTNKTIIFIAHRLSTIKHCDQIFVMKNGFIVEQGNHSELLTLKSHYHNLVNTEFYAS